VEERESVLIVIDGDEKTELAAEAIARGIMETWGWGGTRITIKPGAIFRVEDLLRADVFFIGCERPSPPEFGGLEELLQHINLAGRRCGIFSMAVPPSITETTETIRYLEGILKVSEAKLFSTPFYDTGTADYPVLTGVALKAWLGRVYGLKVGDVPLSLHGDMTAAREEAGAEGAGEAREDDTTETQEGGQDGEEA